MTTPVHVCGFECGFVNVSPGSAADHWTWSGANGTPLLETGIVRTGGYSVNCTSTATLGTNIRHYLGTGSPTVAVLRLYFYLDRVPSITTYFAVLNANSNTGRIQVKTDGTVQATVVGVTTTDGPVVSPNGWHQLDMRLNVAANPWVLDWAIDGMAQTQVSAAQTANTILQMELGPNGGSTGMTVYFDDVIASVTSGDYPIGSGEVHGYLPNIVGTHNLSASEFQDSSANILTAGDTTSFALIQRPAPLDLTDYVEQLVIGATHYLEYGFDDEATDPYAINGVQATVLTHRVGAGTSASSKAQLWDGTTATDLVAAAAPAQAGSYLTKCFALTPTGTAWTRAKLNNAWLRWGFATGITDGPCLDAAVLEADFGISLPSLTVAGQQLVNDTTLTLNTAVGLPLNPQFDLIVESEIERVVDTGSAPTYTVARDPAQAVQHNVGAVVDLLPFRAGALVLPRSAVAPLNPYLGQAWYDTVNKQTKVYNGATWDTL